MAKEIEVKYLVKKNWKKLINPSSIKKIDVITQGYISSDNGKVVRVRLVEDGSGPAYDPVAPTGYVTLKGPTKGISRDEFEYRIPAADANIMLKTMCQWDLVKKTRYHIEENDGHVWELDVFRGKNIGLVVAELELGTAKEKFQKPSWIDKDVTCERKYSNSNLAKKPFKAW